MEMVQISRHLKFSTSKPLKQAGMALNVLSQFKALRRLIEQRAVESFAVRRQSLGAALIVDLDVFKDSQSGFIPGFEMAGVNEFFFEAGPEALDEGIRRQASALR